MMIDFNNPSSYKNCAKKFYEIYVCMPPKNTIVLNKLEQSDIVKQLGGKTYFSVTEIEKLYKTNPSMITKLQQLVAQGHAYAVTDATPFVLCGTVGEMWAISADKLAKTYTFLQNGQPLQINQQTLNQRMKGSYLDWTSIRTSQFAISGQNMACFVPSSQKGQIRTSWGAVLNINGVGVTHGKGDFIVCAKLPNGKPNLADRWVVNGEIFATTYNNQGWTDCLNLSSVKNITIDSLPRLVPQQTSNSDSSIDFNVFKQKCDTLMKELQKVYKFSVKSNTYTTEKNYTGGAFEVEFANAYEAKYIIGGNFSHTFKVRSQKSNDVMVDKTVSTDETIVRLACNLAHSNSAIAMFITPNKVAGGFYDLAFPHNSDIKDETAWLCKVGTLKDINCAEEVKLFKERCADGCDFLDNRNSVKESYLNAELLLADINSSNVNSSIGVSHILEEVYSKLTTDTLKERASICFNEYNNLNIGFGSASLAFASRKEKEVKGSMIGVRTLAHRMNLKSLIKYLVSACQQEETRNDALSILYSLSENALTEAVAKLFYDSNNPNLTTLWKRLDLQYMFKSRIDLCIHNQPESNINNRRVCIDLHFGGFQDVFVRCIYTVSGSYAFEFIPKEPVAGYNLESTNLYSVDKDYDNYLGVCKQLKDSCYNCFIDSTKSSKTFIDNIPKYLISTEFEYLGMLGGKIALFFKAISSSSDAQYNRDAKTYKVKFTLGNDTRVLYMREDDAHTVSVKCTLNGVTFEKSYKLSIKRSISINAMLIFSDICKILKIHPAKELLKSKRLWNNVTMAVSEKIRSREYLNISNINVECGIDNITPVSINLGDSKYEILMRFYLNEKVVGERILVVDFNYDNFDIRNSRSRSMKALSDLKSEYFITDIMFVMHYKYGATDEVGIMHDASFDEDEIEQSFLFTTLSLFSNTKKYQA